MKPLTSIACLLMLASTRRLGAEPAAPVPDSSFNIVFELQVVALPREKALPLIPDLRDAGKSEQAYGRIQELLASGSAQLLGWPILTCSNGERSYVEGVDEIRYATEFAQPTVNFTPDVETNATIKVRPKVDMTVLTPSPTAFETRNAGISLAVDPTVSKDQQTIKLNVEAQDVQLKGYLRTTVEKKGAGGSLSVEQPEFEVKKVTTPLTVHSGERVLLGIFPMSSPANYIELFLLRAEVRPVK